MKLILTAAEKKAATWAELDDASLGKVVKAMMSKIRETSEEQGKLFYLSAAIILCGAAVDANADRLVQTIEGLTIKGQTWGNWKIIIQKQ